MSTVSPKFRRHRNSPKSHGTGKPDFLFPPFVFPHALGQSRESPKKHAPHLEKKTGRRQGTKTGRVMSFLFWGGGVGCLRAESWGTVRWTSEVSLFCSWYWFLRPGLSMVLRGTTRHFWFPFQTSASKHTICVTEYSAGWAKDEGTGLLEISSFWWVPRPRTSDVRGSRSCTSGSSWTARTKRDSSRSGAERTAQPSCPVGCFLFFMFGIFFGGVLFLYIRSTNQERMPFCSHGHWASEGSKLASSISRE